MTEKEYRKLLKERFKNKQKLRNVYNIFIRVKNAENITELNDFDVSKKGINEFSEWFFNVQTSFKITKIDKLDLSAGMTVIHVNGKLEFIPSVLYRSLQRIRYEKVPHMFKENTAYAGLSYNFTCSNDTKDRYMFHIYSDNFNSNPRLLSLAATKLQLLGTLKIITSFYKNGFISKELMDSLVKEHTLKHNEEISKYTLKENLLAEAGIEESEFSKHYEVLLNRGYCEYAKKLRDVYYWIDE